MTRLGSSPPMPRTNARDHGQNAAAPSSATARPYNTGMPAPAAPFASHDSIVVLPIPASPDKTIRASPRTSRGKSFAEEIWPECRTGDLSIHR